MKYILTFLALTFIMACNSDDQDFHPLNGEWSLVNIQCFCAQPEDPINGEISWTFDIENNKLIVVNEVDDDFYILKSGSYDIILGESKITIEDMSYDFLIDGNKLTLSNQPELDGPILNFIKGNSICDKYAIIDPSQFETASTDYSEITNAEIEGYCLNISFSASGCSGNSWEPQLFDSGNILESFPVQRLIKLSLKNEEMCEAYITKQFSFDLRPLVNEATGTTVNFKLTGWDDALLYEKN